MNLITSYFKEELAELKCDETTKAYVVGIFSGFRTSKNDLSKCSITLEYAQARETQNFSRFQNLGDWLFFRSTVFYDGMKEWDEYYQSVARLSYYSCYQLLQKQWVVFEELADAFPYLTKNTRKLINRI